MNTLLALIFVASTTPAAASPRDLRLLHQSVEVTVDPTRREIAGETALTVEPVRPDLTVVRLDAEEIQVESAHVDGAMARVASDGHEVRLALPGPSPAVGQPLKVWLRYRATPRRGLLFPPPGGAVVAHTQGSPALTRRWVPTLDHPDERATFELAVTVGAGLAVVGAGRQVSDEPAGPGRHRVRRVVDTAVPPHTVSLAVGKFDDVVLETGVKDLPAVAHVPPGRGPDARATFAALPRVLASLHRWTGTAYPFSTLALVVVDGPTVTAVEGAASPMVDARVLPQADLPVEDVDQAAWVRGLARQWFGVSTVVVEEEDLWIQEGLVSYLASLVDEDLRGVERARDHFRQQVVEPLLATGQPPPVSSGRVQGVLDDDTVRRGAAVFHLLRGAVGDPAFTGVLRRLCAQHRGSTLDRQDLLRAMDGVTGQPQRAWLEAWATRAGYPALTMTTTTGPRPGAAAVRVTQSPRPWPLWTSLVVGHGGVETRVPVSLSTEEGTIGLPFVNQVDWAVLDDEQWLLAAPPVLEERPALAALAGAQEPRTRAAAAAGLRRHRTVEATAALVRALAADGSPVVRVASARSLAGVGRDQVVTALAAALRDKDVEVQVAAARALARTGDVATARALARVAGAKGRMAPRLAAGWALGSHVQEAPDLVERALRLASPGGRVEAQVLRGVALAHPAHPLLLDAAGRGEGSVAAAGLDGLDGAADRTRVLPVVTRRLADPDAAVRTAAAGAAARLLLVEALPALRAALRDEAVGTVRLHLLRAERVLDTP
jgi:aminopeptidase N